MVIIGFNFNKILVQRQSILKGKINIKNNVTIKNVEKSSLFLGKGKQEGIKYSFEFTSKYEPNSVAEIVLEGEILSVEESEKAKEILESWKKNKRIPNETMANVLNNILTRCNIEALILSRDANLPAPIPLPKVQVKQPETKEKSK